MAATWQAPAPCRATAPHGTTGRCPITAGVTRPLWHSGQVPHCCWGDVSPMAQGDYVPGDTTAPAGILLQGPGPGTRYLCKQWGWCVIRCQRCLSLGLSLLSQALRTNIPGIFVMFGSIQHPSEKKKKNQIKENPVLPLLPLVFFYT